METNRLPETGGDGPIETAVAYAQPELLSWILDQADGEADRRQREAKLAAIRRDRLVRPAVFIGAGTCGLGAGANETLAAVRQYLDGHEIKADVIRVGCIGLCSAEPIVDVQLPGKTRVSFSQVSAADVPALLDAVFRGEIPDDLTGTVGVTAGASAPEVLVNELIDRLGELGSARVVPLPGIEENTAFPLPKGLGRD